MQGPWLYLKEKPRPAMDDDLYKWGVSKEAVEGTLGHQKQQQQVHQAWPDCILTVGMRQQCAQASSLARHARLKLVARKYHTLMLLTW